MKTRLRCDAIWAGGSLDRRESYRVTCIMRRLTLPSRTEYTAEDDENLVKYIGKRIPNAALGGRLGNNLYIDLTERVSVMIESA